jgi:metal-dependent amidase/aminoacylase/carboxypeptidase family protein
MVYAEPTVLSNASANIEGLAYNNVRAALPVTETTDLPYSSRIAGRMHACGHDGHMSMLLGATRHLCETRNFRGSVAAEENGGEGLKW